MSNYLVVTIGRGITVEHHPDDDWAVILNDSAWLAFKSEIDSLIRVTFGVTVQHIFEFDSKSGQWDGVEEQSTLFSVVLDDNTSPSLFMKFKNRIPDIAKKYHQEAIHVAIGNSVLVDAAE